MAGRWLAFAVTAVLAFVPCAIAATGAENAPSEKLLTNDSMILSWVVGVGILAGTLIAGFKHPGRSHLD